jgi:hypothetical protein
VETVAIVLLVLLLFGLAWVGILYLDARNSGWSDLARAYRAAGLFRGSVWSLESYWMVRMNWAGCEESLVQLFPRLPRDVSDERICAGQNNLWVGAGPEGLYLVPHFASRAFHPPVLVPWADVAVYEARVNWLGSITGMHAGLFGKAGPDGGLWSVDFRVFRFRRAPAVLLEVRKDHADRIAEAAGAAFPEVTAVGDAGGALTGG